MKKTLLFLLLISGQVSAQVVAEIRRGELAVTYDCAALDSIPKEKKKYEVPLTLFQVQANPAVRAGYILSTGTNSNTGKPFFLARYRTDSPSIILDEKLYSALTEEERGNLKCSFDLTYNHIKHITVYSCSYITQSGEVLPVHRRFFKMIDKTIPEFPQDLNKIQKAKAKLTTWKMKLTPEQEKHRPLITTPEIRKWEAGGECRLEVVADFAVPSPDPDVIHPLADKVMDYFRKIIKAETKTVTQNVVDWILGLRNESV